LAVQVADVSAVLSEKVQVRLGLVVVLAWAVDEAWAVAAL